jgi:DNA-binding NarL/FixJ family response regulator
MTTAPRILVVDRAPVFAAGVEAAFARMNHPVTLEHLKHLPSLDALPQPAPDLLLLEASWGAQHELGLIRQLRERHPHLRCILNVFDGKAGLAAAVRQAGGAGVFNKALNPPMLVSLCLQVLQEDCFIPTAIGEGKTEGVHNVAELISLLFHPLHHDGLLTFYGEVVDALEHFCQFGHHLSRVCLPALLDCLLVILQRSDEEE